MDLKAALPQLFPVAITWAKDAAERAALTGAPLTSSEELLASSVGVAHPERVRVAVVPHLPQPQQPQLLLAAQQTGLLGPGTIGLTFGYTVFIVRGNRTRQVLSHELRHVHQYEQLGSIAQFLPVYLAQIVEVGYFNAPLEADARAHEVREI